MIHYYAHAPLPAQEKIGGTRSVAKPPSLVPPYSLTVVVVVERDRANVGDKALLRGWIGYLGSKSRATCPQRPPGSVMPATALCARKRGPPAGIQFPLLWHVFVFPQGRKEKRRRRFALPAQSKFRTSPQNRFANLKAATREREGTRQVLHFGAATSFLVQKWYRKSLPPA